MKTLAELRKYIYDFLDVEVFDISESLLNTWAKEGYDRIIKIARRLPHFEQEFNTAVSSGEGSIDYPADLESIDWLTVGGRIVDPVDYREAYDDFVSWDGHATSGWPTHYSAHNGKLYFWPTPSADYDIVIQGWRKPSDWVAVSGTPDMPEPFESVLLSFMLYRAYGHQGLIEDAQAEKVEFESQLGQLTSWEKETPTQRPMIMGGGKRRRRSGPAPLTFPIVMG